MEKPTKLDLYISKVTDDYGDCKFIATGTAWSCSQCDKEVTEGFLCDNLDFKYNTYGKVYCQDCQDKCTMSKCIHIKGEHQHIKFTKS